MTGPTTSLHRVGVEEALLLVDPGAGELRNVAAHVLHEHRSAADDEEAVRVVDWLRSWPPALVAIADGSPYRAGGVVVDVVARTEEAAL